MTETANLVIAVDAKGVKTATDDLKKLGGVSRDTESRVKSFGTAVGSLAAAFAGGAFFQSVIANTIESEDALAQLNATIKSTGGAAGLSSDELVAMAQGLQQVTTFGDDAIISMQSQLLTFTKIGKDAVPAATEAILDLATKMGGDLKGAAVQVGKALNDPVQGISALSKVGVSFTEQQKEVIKALVKTGDVSSAQKIILNELAVEFGGAARAARDTFGGALTSLKNSFGDLLEGGGGNLTEAKTAVEELNTAISDPRVKEAFATIVSGVLNVATAAANALPALTGFTDWVGETLAAAVGGPAADDLVRTSDAIAKLKDELSGFDQQTGLAKYLNKDRVADMRKELVRLEEQYKAGEAAQLAAYEAQRKLDEQTKLSNENNKSSIPTIVVKTKAQIAAEKAAARAAKAAAEHTKTLNEQIAVLQLQAETVGKSTTEVTLLKLAQDGATESQLMSARTALESISAQEKKIKSDKKAADDKKKDAADTEQFVKSMMSDTEKLAAQQQKLYDLYKAGKISQDQYSRGSQEVSNGMIKIVEESNKANGALDDFAKTAQQNIQSQLADTLTTGFQGSFQDILSSWGQLLQRMIAEAAAAQLTKSLFSSIGIGADGAGAGAALSGIGDFFAGFFDNGGNIPSGQFGVVGEKGPEIVRGPVNVTGREDTKRLSGSNTIIINQPGVSNTREAERSAGAIRRAVYGAVNSGSRYA